jgi:hypothetical protein
VNKRSQRLAHDGSRYVWPSRVSTQIDKNRMKRSAPEAGLARRAKLRQDELLRQRNDLAWFLARDML